MTRTGRQWFMRSLFRSLTERKARVAVAALSVLIASAIIVSALGVSLGIRAKLGGELKSYGANIVVSGGSLDEAALSKTLGAIPAIEDYSLQLYASGRVKGGSVEVIGMDIKRASQWKITGALPLAGSAEALAGANLREALGIEPGSRLEAEAMAGASSLRISGFVERGGPEDSALIMHLAEAQALFGQKGGVSAALVRARDGMIEEAVSAIKAAVPGSEVKTMRQVAQAEESFLGKIELLMALVSLVVLVAASISLSSTMSATVLERMREIGLMKALGGTRRDIGAFFLAESCAIGIMGGLCGYAAGFLAAQAVSRGAFGSFIPMSPWLLPLALAIGVIIASSASLLPLAGALRVRPSVILRGQ